MSNTLPPLVLASDVPKLPVIAIDCGDDIAEIKDVVFNPATQKLEGFTLNKRGWFRGKLKATLPADAIHAIGPDAVMVASTAKLVDVGDSPVELDTKTDSVTVVGTRVLSASGEDLGEIVDVVLATGPIPAAKGYKVSSANGERYVPITAQLALSDNNLLLPEAATEFVSNDLAGFGAAIDNYRSGLETAQ